MATEHILPFATVFTDEAAAYEGLDQQRKGYVHRRIKHSARVYVAGDIHTNSVEGFWSLIKRGIGGVYHAVSQKDVQSYLDEYSFWYNERFSTEPMFQLFLRQIASGSRA